MTGQMTIYDFLTASLPFSWDEDINECKRMLSQMVSDLKLREGRAKWEIWEHVPKFGYRMSYEFEVKKEDVTTTLSDELGKIVAFAKKRNIDISYTAPYFFNRNPNETSYIYVFSTFLDKERQKHK